MPRLNSILLILTLLCLNSCSNDEMGLYYELIEKHGRYGVYKFNMENSPPFLIFIDSLGKLIGFISDTTPNKQYILFNDKNRVFRIYNHKNGIKHGRAYSFYKESGYLESDASFHNGAVWGNTVTYYDSTAQLKETLLTDSLGRVYFKETYDIWGNVLSSKGSISNE